jgi:hypothetical protein
MEENGVLTVRAMQDCHWIAGKQPDPRIWFSLPPLVTQPALLRFSFFIRDQGLGERAGKVHLRLVGSREKRTDIIAQELVCFAEHEVTFSEKIFTADDDIIRLAKRGDFYLVVREIGGLFGSGHSLHVSRFQLQFVPFHDDSVQGCYCRYDKYSSTGDLRIIDTGHWGVLQNWGLFMDDGGVQYDQVLRWTDLGKFLGYPACLLFQGILFPRCRLLLLSRCILLFLLSGTSNDDAAGLTEERVEVIGDDVSASQNSLNQE